MMTKEGQRMIYLLQEKAQRLKAGLEEQDNSKEITPEERMAKALQSCGCPDDWMDLMEQMSMLRRSTNCLEHLRLQDLETALVRIEDDLPTSRQKEIFVQLLLAFGDTRPQWKLEHMNTDELRAGIQAKVEQAVMTLRSQLEQGQGLLDQEADLTDPFFVAAVLYWAQKEGDFQLDVPLAVLGIEAAAVCETERLAGQMRNKVDWLLPLVGLVLLACTGGAISSMLLAEQAARGMFTVMTAAVMAMVAVDAAARFDGRQIGIELGQTERLLNRLRLENLEAARTAETRAAGTAQNHSDPYYA